MAALVDESARIIDSQDIPVSVFTPKYGHVEHDPSELAESVRTSARRLMERHPDKLGSLLGFAVANQGESFLLWDKTTGEPVTPVISWQDSRCGDLSSRLQEEGIDPWFHQKTGLHLSNEWPALKLRFLREHDERLDALCAKGNLVYGQLDAWFLYVFSGSRHFASDHSTACRSGFYNLKTMSWDEELLSFFKGTGVSFPALVDNTETFPGVDLGIGVKLPWLAGGLDQSMALLGQNCTRPQSVKVTYGTCCSCWMNLGSRLALNERLTTSIAWKTKDELVYGLAAEGSSSGNIISWLQRNFHGEWPLANLADVARANADQPDLIFVPAFNGVAAPYWEAEARGTMFGITSGTKPEHIMRAGLDAIAYTVRDMLDAMPPYETVIVDGGMTANTYLMQKQADVLNRTLLRNTNMEGTVTGVAMLALMALGRFLGPETCETDQVITPDPDHSEKGYEAWKKSLKATIDYYKH